MSSGAFVTGRVLAKESRSLQYRRIARVALVSALSFGPVWAIPAWAQQVTLAAQAQTNAAVFRDQVGRRLTFICPAQVNINQDIYGTDVYTDTSPICTAAAHAGLFTKGTSAAVTIVMEGRKEFFTASSRNKVQSLSYGPWAGTYSFVRTSQPGQIDWSTTIVQVATDYLTPITVECPAAGSVMGDIWGTDVYPDDSAICVAGVHAGAITLAGGTLTLTRVPKQASFPSTTRYQITSRMWSDPAWRSYPQPFSVAAATVPAAAPTVNGVLVQPTPTTGTITPMTQATATATAPVGATAGPIASGQNPIANSNKDLFGPPAPRTISLSPFTAGGGLTVLIARTIGLPAFTASGGSGTVAGRTIPLAQFIATGVGSAPVSSRTISLPPFTASGSQITIATRSLAQSATSDATTLPASRTIGLPGLQGQGSASLIASRAVLLPAYSAIGSSGTVVSRTIALPAYASVGPPGVLPRTIKLPTFTAVGVP